MPHRPLAPDDMSFGHVYVSEYISVYGIYIGTGIVRICYQIHAVSYIFHGARTAVETVNVDNGTWNRRSVSTLFLYVRDRDGRPDWDQSLRPSAAATSDEI